jgi:type III secretory pathway component EscT
VGRWQELGAHGEVPVTDPGLLESVARLLGAEGIDLGAWGLAWARVAPLIAIVPAFGLRALPAAVRAAVGLMLALVIAPALRVTAHSPGPYTLLVLLEIARGLPVALAAAVPLWAATMAGGVIDALRGSQDVVSVPTVEGRATGLGVLFSLLAAVLFFSAGGPARVAGSLAQPGLEVAGPLARAAFDLSAGIGIAVAIAAPLVAASIVVELSFALVARAASPAQVHALLAPVRSIVLLLCAAVVFDRMAALLRVLVARG